MKNFYRYAALLVCTFASLSSLAAAETEIAVAAKQPQVLTIEDSVALAMKNNIALESSAIDARMKKRDYELSWNVFIPSVQTTGTLARTNMTEATVPKYSPVTIPGIGTIALPSGTTTVTLDEKDRWTAMANLGISLNLNLALFEGLRATRLGYETGKLSYEQARSQTEKNVRKAFYGILLQQQSLDIAKGKLATSIERYNQTKINYTNGLVPELSLLQTQLSVEMQKPAIEETELNLEQQKNMFAFLLGLPVGTVVQLSGEINPAIKTLDADELVSKHLGDRLDLAMLHKSGELMKTQYRATQLQRFTPSLSLNQSYAPRLSAIDDEWTDQDNWTDSSGAFSATLAFNLTNILPFTASGKSASDIKDSIQKTDLAFRQAQYNAELEIRNLVKKLEKSRTSIGTLELSVAIADKAYKLTEQRYKAGTVEILDLRDAENSLMQARIGLLAEKFNYISTVLDLETATNTKLN